MNPVDVSLYGLVDPTRAGGRLLAELAVAAAEGGATLIQYRDKRADTRAMVATAREIVGALPAGVPLLVNDRVDVALAAAAAGVHLGQDDMHAADARALLGPDAIIGLTIKNERDVADAPVGLIDYACIGGVFETLSKDNPDPPIGLDGLSRLVAALRVAAPGMPIGAIAGIDADNAAAVVAAGADGIAVVSALFLADDVAGSARQLAAIVAKARQARLAETQP